MKRKSAEIYIIIGLYPNETDWKRRGTHAPHTKKGAAMTLRQALLKCRKRLLRPDGLFRPVFRRIRRFA